MKSGICIEDVNHIYSKQANRQLLDPSLCAFKRVWVGDVIHDQRHVAPPVVHGQQAVVPTSMVQYINACILHQLATHRSCPAVSLQDACQIRCPWWPVYNAVVMTAILLLTRSLHYTAMCIKFYIIYLITERFHYNYLSISSEKPFWFDKPDLKRDGLVLKGHCLCHVCRCNKFYYIIVSIDAIIIQ